MAKHYQKTSAVKGKSASKSQKNSRKKKKSAARAVLIALLVVVFVLAAIIAGALLFGELPEENGAAGAVSESEASEAASSQPAGLQFPYLLEEQNIEIRSLLNASIANPDGGGDCGGYRRSGAEKHHGSVYLPRVVRGRAFGRNDFPLRDSRSPG